MKASLGKLIKAGKGKKFIMLCDDDEGNGYHSCWYGASYSLRENKELVTSGMIHDDFKPSEFVTLG